MYPLIYKPVLTHSSLVKHDVPVHNQSGADLMFTVLIVESDPSSRDDLIALLKEIDPSVRIEAILPAREDLLQWLRYKSRPSLIFMNAEWSGSKNFEPMGEAYASIPLVWILPAINDKDLSIQYEGIDYLQKPFYKEKIKGLLQKFRGLQDHFISSYRQSGLSTGLSRKKSRVLVKRGTEFRTVKFQDIAYFFTENKIVFLVNNRNEKYIVDKSLRDLEEELDRSIFFRANRKFIISIDYIKKVKQLEKSQLVVELQTPTPEQLIISRENATQFKRWLESS